MKVFDDMSKIPRKYTVGRSLTVFNSSLIKIPSCAVDGDKQSAKRRHHSTDSTNNVSHHVVCYKYRITIYIEYMSTVILFTNKFKS